MSLGRLPLPDPLYFRSLTLPNVNAVDFLSIYICSDVKRGQILEAEAEAEDKT